LVQPPVCIYSQLDAKKEAEKAQEKTARQQTSQNRDYLNSNLAVKPDTGSSQAKNFVGSPDMSP
jgi:hypothetical protein